MKTITAVLLGLFIGINALVAKPLPESLAVLTDIKAAKEQSKTSGKPVFIEFMSGKCAHCLAFKKNVLSDPAFITFANRNLIVVIHDYQDLDDLPEQEQKARNELREKFKVKGFPTIILVDKGGKILLRIEGYGGTAADKIITSLKTACADAPGKKE